MVEVRVRIRVRVRVRVRVNFRIRVEVGLAARVRGRMPQMGVEGGWRGRCLGEVDSPTVLIAGFCYTRSRPTHTHTHIYTYTHINTYIHTPPPSASTCAPQGVAFLNCERLPGSHEYRNLQLVCS